VNEDRAVFEITSYRGDAVLMSRADFDALNETAMLLRSPANARRLLKSLAQAQAGERNIHKFS
jgi:antitoxin YefM